MEMDSHNLGIKFNYQQQAKISFMMFWMQMRHWLKLWLRITLVIIIRANIYSLLDYYTQNII